MPIEISCPKCVRKFRVPDKFAGKRIKCPKCQAAIGIPASGQPSEARHAGKKPPSRKPPTAGVAAPAKPAPEQWYLQTEDGEQFGPVSREDLDGWAAEGRLDASCQLLREGWEQWKWAQEVFPELAEPGNRLPAAAEENPFAGIADAVDGGTPAGANFPAVDPSQTDSAESAAGPPAVGRASDPARIRRTLADILRPLLKFLSIMGFVGAGLSAYLLIRLLWTLVRLWSMFSDLGGSPPWQFFVALLATVALLAAMVLYMTASYFLLGFAQRIDVFLRRDQGQELDRAMPSYRKLWQFVYLATAIVVVVYLIIIMLEWTIPMPEMM